MYLVGKYKNKRNVNQLSKTVDRIKKHYKSLRSACHNTDMHWSQFHRSTTLAQKKMAQRKYILKLETSDIASIGNFFQSDEASFPLPDKKYSGKCFMKRTLSRACTLRKYKPRYVKLQGKLPFWQSCCEVCQNFEFVVNNASQFLNGIPKTIDNCVDSSMCEYNTYFPKLDCVIRECSSCGTDTLKLKLERLNADYLNDTCIRFLVKQWHNKKERIAGSDKYGTYIHWKHEMLSYRDLLDKYIDLLVKMSSHSFFSLELPPIFGV